MHYIRVKVDLMFSFVPRPRIHLMLCITANYDLKGFVANTVSTAKT